MYTNRALGLEVPWGRFTELVDEAREFSSLYSSDPVIKQVLRRVPEAARKQILETCHCEIREAEATGCPIVCGEGRRALLERLIERRNSEADLKDQASIGVLETYLRFIPSFMTPRGIDELCEIKQIPSLRQYARSFSVAMEELAAECATPRALATALREAMDSADFSARLAGVYEATSTALSVAGLLPIVGLPASIASLGSSLGGRVSASRAQEARWFEFAPEIARQMHLRELRSKLEAALKAGSNS